MWFQNYTLPGTRWPSINVDWAKEWLSSPAVSIFRNKVKGLACTGVSTHFLDRVRQYIFSRLSGPYWLCHSYSISLQHRESKLWPGKLHLQTQACGGCGVSDPWSPVHASLACIFAGSFQEILISIIHQPEKTSARKLVHLNAKLCRLFLNTRVEYM